MSSQKNSMFFQHYLSIGIIFLLTNFAIAQSIERIYPTFIQNGQVLKEATFGGLSSPQFSEVDLNNDGILDLYIYDKIGKISLTYLNQGTPNTIDYVAAPQYEKNFPPLTEWVLLRDYNGDNIPDIFAYSSIPGIPGIEVYTGFYNADNEIAFRQNNLSGGQFNIIYYPGSSGNNNLFVSSADYPAVDDIDGDGDLDILTFNIAGGITEFYANQSIERGFGRDSLIFVLADACWGKFFESGISKEVDLGPSPNECALNFQSAESRSGVHAGSTLLTLDIDNDQDKEVILGDISFPNLNLVINGGTAQNAYMTDQVVNFPGNSVPVNLPLFPAAFFLDINNDGQKDLIASPNLGNDVGETFECAWYYENIGTTQNPIFDYRQQDLFVGDMLDFGTGAQPVFVDWNQDGLLDLVVGNKTFFVPGGMRNARIFLFENRGTTTEPIFELTNDDLWEMNQLSQSAWRFTPAFGDLDGDGDLDALIGEEFGNLFYSENIAGAGNPFEFTTPVYAYQFIDIGQVSRPQIIDINRDGLLDLVLGERNGNVNYFENTGTRENPIFPADPTNNFFGSIDTRAQGQVTGYSAPAVLEIDGEYQIFAGNEDGKILRYTDIEGNLAGIFTQVSDDFANLDLGREIQPAFADIDNDGFLEMAVGTFRGGISFFKTDLKSQITSASNIITAATWNIYPNPVSNTLFIDLDINLEPSHLKIYNALGQSVHEQSYQPTLDLVNLNTGVYVLEIATAKGRLVRKFSKLR